MPASPLKAKAQMPQPRARAKQDLHKQSRCLGRRLGGSEDHDKALLQLARRAAGPSRRGLSALTWLAALEIGEGGSLDVSRSVST